MNISFWLNKNDLKLSGRGNQERKLVLLQKDFSESLFEVISSFNYFSNFRSADNLARLASSYGRLWK